MSKVVRYVGAALLELPLDEAEAVVTSWEDWEESVSIQVLLRYQYFQPMHRDSKTH